MRDVKLPDGTWATTAIYAGFSPPPAQCPGGCAWRDEGPPSSERPRVQAQRCPACGYVRARYLDDPHPELANPAGPSEPT